MAELDYSIEARNVLNKFHSVERVVYVEGDDDVAFWEFLFDKFSAIKVKIEESGGKEALQARIRDVIEDRAEFYVAVDSDFDIFFDAERHPQVLRTFGYSMENTIISDVVLQKVISRVAKLPRNQVSIDYCASWIAKIESDLKSIVLADAINRINKLGHPVLADNCDRFLTSRKSSDFCPNRIQSHLDAFNIDIEPEAEESIVKVMEQHGLLWRDILRGHFLMSAAFRFIKKYITKIKSAVSISREMLFGSLLFAFEASFNENHRHYEYYRLLFVHQLRDG